MAKKVVRIVCDVCGSPDAYEWRVTTKIPVRRQLIIDLCENCMDPINKIIAKGRPVKDPTKVKKPYRTFADTKVSEVRSVPKTD